MIKLILRSETYQILNLLLGNPNKIFNFVSKIRKRLKENICRKMARERFRLSESRVEFSNSAERKQARPKVRAEVFANAIKHDFKGKNPTTRWSDIVVLK